MEESRARCDELYADLLDVQEKLRMIQLQSLSTMPSQRSSQPLQLEEQQETDESRYGYDNKRVKIGEVLLQRDCQFVSDYFFIMRFVS